MLVYELLEFGPSFENSTFSIACHQSELKGIVLSKINLPSGTT